MRHGDADGVPSAGNFWHRRTAGFAAPNADVVELVDTQDLKS